MIRFPRRSTATRRLPAGVQAKLARATLRAAHTAAENGKCAVAEALFVAGNVRLQAAGAGARTKGAFLKTLDVGMEGAKVGTAIAECRERQRATRGPSGATT